MHLTDRRCRGRVRRGAGAVPVLVAALCLGTVMGERSGHAAPPVPAPARPPAAAAPPPGTPAAEPDPSEQAPSGGAERPTTTPPAQPPVAPPPPAGGGQPGAVAPPAGPPLQPPPSGRYALRKKRHAVWLATAIIAGVGTIVTGSWGLADTSLATSAAKSHDWAEFDKLRSQQEVLYYTCGALGAVTLVGLVLYLVTGSEVPVEVGPTGAGVTPRLTLAPGPGSAWATATWRF